MGISFWEVFVVFCVGLLFFKPQEIKNFLKSVFSIKRTMESEIKETVGSIFEEEDGKKIEFFEVSKKCQKQQ